MSAFPMACNIAHARNVKNAHLAHKAELRKKEDILLKLQTFSIHKPEHHKPQDNSLIVHHACSKLDASKMPTNSTATALTTAATNHSTSAGPAPLVSTTTIPVIELTANFRNVIHQLKSINTDELIRKTFGSNHN
uniref:Uncharacterized protein n=1 Tax=Panagrellus redivivus TaxID=6233 RepID=A0A7E4W5D6_PANRE